MVIHLVDCTPDREMELGRRQLRVRRCLPGRNRCLVRLALGRPDPNAFADGANGIEGLRVLRAQFSRHAWYVLRCAVHPIRLDRRDHRHHALDDRSNGCHLAW